MYEIVENNNHPTVTSNTKQKKNEKRNMELILFRQVLFNFKSAKLNSQIIC